MKRRGFLGLIGGAAVAGPSMAKQAVSSTLADTGLAGLALHAPGTFGGDIGLLPAQTVPEDWVGQLAKVSMRSAAEHSRRQREQYINGLDPDLTTYRSFALHAKISIQRKREYWRGLENQKSWLQRRIDGIMDW